MTHKQTKEKIKRELCPCKCHKDWRNDPGIGCDVEKCRNFWAKHPEKSKLEKFKTRFEQRISEYCSWELEGTAVSSRLERRKEFYSFIIREFRELAEYIQSHSAPPGDMENPRLSGWYLGHFDGLERFIKELNL